MKIVAVAPMHTPRSSFGTKHYPFQRAVAPPSFAKYFEKFPKLAKIYQKPRAPPFLQILDPPLAWKRL